MSGDSRREREKGEATGEIIVSRYATSRLKFVVLRVTQPTNLYPTITQLSLCKIHTSHRFDNQAIYNTERDKRAQMKICSLIVL